MNWYSFIFSEKKSVRLQRHLLFWLLWGIYFISSYYHFEQSGLRKIEFEPWNIPFFIKSVLLLGVHIIACYYFINYLTPQYLFKAKYVGLVMHIIILTGFIFLASYFIHNTLVPLVNTTFNYTPTIANQHILWTSITSGLLSAPKIISAAVVIKLLKEWWLKQKEKERLEKEKLITELKLLKAQMHPELLFSSLDNICLLADKKEMQKASMFLLKLADILSYMLYESEHELVLLKKEINVIKDYLFLEKARMGDRLEIDVAVKGEPGTLMIAPLLLLSVIENSFLYIDNKKLERNWMNLEIQIDRTEFKMKLIHGKMNDPLTAVANKNANAKTIKRLEFFYPGNYELKSTIEPEIMMTTLKISLKTPEVKNENSIYNYERLEYVTI